MEEYVYVYAARSGTWGYANNSKIKASTLMVFTDVYHLGKHIIQEWLNVKDRNREISERSYRIREKSLGSGTFENWIVELGRSSPKVYKIPLNKEPNRRRPISSIELFREIKNCEELKKEFIKMMLKE